MQDEPTTNLHLEVRLTTAQRQALEPALLRARAAELGEVRRRNIRLTAGYGDPTARDVLDDEGRRAQSRHDALDAVLQALARAP